MVAQTAFKYNVGDKARLCDMDEHNDEGSNLAHACLLQIGDGAFVKRSDESWRYAIVEDRDYGNSPYIEFRVDSGSCVKRISSERWGALICGIRSFHPQTQEECEISTRADFYPIKIGRQRNFYRPSLVTNSESRYDGDEYCVTRRDQMHKHKSLPTLGLKGIRNNTNSVDIPKSVRFTLRDTLLDRVTELPTISTKA